MERSNLHAHAERDIYREHPHAPAHLFRPGATYCVTARTLEGRPAMADPHRRQEVIDALHFAASRRAWTPLAWVVLTNHYHCLLQAPETEALTLRRLVLAVHRFTSSEWNDRDKCRGRQVWYQYWDTCVTHESSFWARLNYIHYNPVKHGLVDDPADYPYSSYRVWQERGDSNLRYIQDAYPWDRLDLE